MKDARRHIGLATSGLGDSQRRVLEILKREGDRSVGELAGELELATETVRGHLRALIGHDLVERAGARKKGPGRPEILYGLTPDAESLFPAAEGRLLHELAAYMLEEGHREVLEGFFERRTETLKENARARLEGLTGRERLDEIAVILSEAGFMAEVVEEEDRREAGPGDGKTREPRLRLCHCPLKEIVSVSPLPCRAEISWIRDLLGEDLARRSWMPNGDRTCTYAIGIGNRDLDEEGA